MTVGLPKAKAGPFLAKMLMAIMLFTEVMPLEGMNAVDSLNPLYRVLPADRFTVVEKWEQVRSPEIPLSQVTGFFRGENAEGGAVGIVVHLVTPGYGGDLAILVSLDMEGTVEQVMLVTHNETSCHVPGVTDGSWLERFAGLRLSEKLKLLVGVKPETRGEIDAISGGTITTRAVTGAVAEARTAFFLTRSAGLVE